MATKLPAEIVAALEKGKTLRIRAGARHRFIGIWHVVVQGRVFVRSWSIKPRSWYRTFVTDPRGAIQVLKRTIPIRAVRTRSAALKAAVDRAYLRKYATKWEAKYARDLCRPKSRATTIEIRPAAG